MLLVLKKKKITTVLMWVCQSLGERVPQPSQTFDMADNSEDLTTFFGHHQNYD